MVRESKLTQLEFVRGVPEQMPAKQVVELAKRAGITLTVQGVYTMKYVLRKARAVQMQTQGPNTQSTSSSSTSERGYRATESGRARSKAAAARDARFPSMSAEQQLEVLIKRVGVLRARAACDKIEGSFRG